jgi:predicted dehydrogenase
MAPIRVGIIGLGAATELKITGTWGVFAHLRSIQALSSEYELVAVANSTVESAQRSIDFHKLPNTTKAYGNANDIAADPNVDLVVISVTVPRHHSLAMAVLKHKKSLFIEWPLAATVEQAEEMTRFALEKGVKTIVALQGRL